MKGKARLTGNDPVPNFNQLSELHGINVATLRDRWYRQKLRGDDLISPTWQMRKTGSTVVGDICPGCGAPNNSRVISTKFEPDGKLIRLRHRECTSCRAQYWTQETRLVPEIQPPAKTEEPVQKAEKPAPLPETSRINFNGQLLEFNLAAEKFKEKEPVSPLTAAIAQWRANGCTDDAQLLKVAKTMFGKPNKDSDDDD